MSHHQNTDGSLTMSAQAPIAPAAELDRLNSADAPAAVATLVC